MVFTLILRDLRICPFDFIEHLRSRCCYFSVSMWTTPEGVLSVRSSQDWSRLSALVASAIGANTVVARLQASSPFNTL